MEVPTSKVGVVTFFVVENCMKMKEFGPQGSVHPWHPLRFANAITNQSRLWLVKGNFHSTSVTVQNLTFSQKSVRNHFLMCL